MVPSLPVRDKSSDSSLLGLLNASRGGGEENYFGRAEQGPKSRRPNHMFFFCGIWLE